MKFIQCKCNPKTEAAVRALIFSRSFSEESMLENPPDYFSIKRLKKPWATAGTRVNSTNPKGWCRGFFQNAKQ
jgi:hypothetical protein